MGSQKDNESFIFWGIPMSPQSNHLYGQNKFTGRRFKNDNGYSKDFQLWWQSNYKMMQEATRELTIAIEKHALMIRVDRYFCFHTNSLYTKKGRRAKIMDVSNRIKAFDDNLANHLMIDDKFFWKGTEEKIEVNEDVQECVIVRIRPYRPRTLSELKKALNLKITDF